MESLLPWTPDPGHWASASTATPNYTGGMSDCDILGHGPALAVSSSPATHRPSHDRPAKA